MSADANPENSIQSCPKFPYPTEMGQISNVTLLPYKAGRTRYERLVPLCHRQRSADVTQELAESLGDWSGEKVKPFNMSLEEKCTFYRPYCQPGSPPGCCAFDDVNEDEDEMCNDGEHCVFTHCGTIWQGLRCNPNNTCLSLTQCDWEPYCDVSCHKRYVKFKNSTQGFLKSCLENPPATSKSSVFGCPPTVAIEGDTVVSQCHLNLTHHYNPVSDVTYNWAVFLNGTQLTDKDAYMNMSSSGELTIALHNVSSKLSAPMCYAERLEQYEKKSSLLGWLLGWHTGQSDEEKEKDSERRVDGVGYQESSQPLVVDPLDNFQTRAIKSIELVVTKRVEDNVVSCNMEYEHIPEYARYTRFIWFGMMLYDRWYFLDYDPENLTFGYDNPKPANFPKANHLNHSYRVLVNTHGHPKKNYTNRRILSEKLVTENVYISEAYGGLVVCSVYTEVGLFANYTLVHPKNPDDLYVNKPPFHVTEWVSLSVFLVLIYLGLGSGVTHFFRQRDKHKVIISVFKTMCLSDVYSPVSPLSDSFCVEEGSGCMEMGPVPAGRATAGTSQRLESVPEDDLIGPASRTGTSPGGLSSALPPSTRLSFEFDGINSESTAESRLGSTEQPTDAYEFDVTFSRLREEADAVLVKSRRFHINVPVELEALKVSSKRLKFEKLIGAGNFGMVHQATLTYASGTRVKVAAKILKDNATFDVLKDLVVEATCMATVGSHEHLVSLKAFCFGSKPCLVTEFCAHGDLKKFLTNKIALLPAEISNEIPALFYQWVLEIATGVDFLHSKKFVHRDLACRNVLLDEGLQCKVSDFGLARDVSNADYYRISSSTPLPFRWLAPEIFQQAKFTLASDVWSFGVTVWEIFSYGTQPYGDKHTLNAVSSYVQTGGRLVMPQHTDDRLVELVSRCFPGEVTARASLPELLPALRELASEYKSNSAPVMAAL